MGGYAFNHMGKKRMVKEIADIPSPSKAMKNAILEDTQPEITSPGRAV